MGPCIYPKPATPMLIVLTQNQQYPC